MHTHTCGNLSTIPTKRGLYNISLNAIIVSAFKGLKIKELHSFMKCLSLKEGISDRGRQRTQTTRIYIRNSNIISWLKISSADGFQIGFAQNILDRHSEIMNILKLDPFYIVVFYAQLLCSKKCGLSLNTATFFEHTKIIRAKKKCHLDIGSTQYKKELIQ